MRKPGGFLAIAATVAAMTASAWLPTRALAAPQGLQVLPGPAIYGFGTNQLGEMGNGGTTATPSLSPVPANGPPGTLTQLATGLRSAGALLADGTLWTWGQNYYHQLGYSSGDPVVTTPHQVPGLSGIVQFALSDEGNGYAVTSGGTIWAWGDNSYGQLGNGSTSASDTPVQVPGLDGITQVAAGPYYVLALKSDGTVWAWGRNGDGSLGDGSTTERLRPERVPGLTGITQVTAAGVSYAVRSDGTLFSWGPNSIGQLGNGTVGASTTTPAPVPGLTSVTQVASSGIFTLAIAGSSERVWTWGDNSCGELGDGTAVARASPEPIGLVGVSQVVTGIAGILIRSSAAIRYDGTLLTWGCNGLGQLATGTTQGTSYPSLVTSLTRVSQFAFGDDSPTLFQVGAYALGVGSLPTVTVPSLTGDSTARASQALQAAGLVLGTVTSAVDYSCNNLGTVMRQNPLAGSSVSPGSAVSITIGKTPPPPHQCP